MMIKTISTTMLKNNCAPDTGWSHRIKFQNRFSNTAVSNSRKVAVNKHGSNLSVWNFKYSLLCHQNQQSTLQNFYCTNRNTFGKHFIVFSFF